MRRKMSLILACIAFVLFVISHENKQEITIVIPSNTAEVYSYCLEEISPTSNTIKIYASEGLEDTSIILQGLYDEDTTEQYLTQGIATKLKVKKNRWYKIGVSIQNTTNTDRVVTLLVKGVRIKLKS